MACATTFAPALSSAVLNVDLTIGGISGDAEDDVGDDAMIDPYRRFVPCAKSEKRLKTSHTSLNINDKRVLYIPNSLRSPHCAGARRWQ
jgi:hypothetical protein